MDYKLTRLKEAIDEQKERIDSMKLGTQYAEGYVDAIKFVSGLINLVDQLPQPPTDTKS